MAESTQVTLKRWYRQAGEPAPLPFVPRLLKVDAAEVGRAVKAGALRVFSFTAQDGHTFRFVPWADIRRYRPNPLTARSMHAAMRRMLAA